MSFILRSVHLDDVEALFELSKFVFLINLPRDKKQIEHQVKSSNQAFLNPHKDFAKNYYFFVLEDLKTSQIIGASLIHAQHGTKDSPHFYLQVGQDYKYSETISTGFVHGTLKLGYETDGPTEIGGLVLHPDYRGHPEKLGKRLSFVRFLYMGLYPERFKSIVHSELLPPLDQNENSPLWEALGRKFMNMDYHVADKLSQSNKEFILNLFPQELIYISLLPVPARDAIGRVGKDTLPVKKMLESVGFRYTHQVDPFDGGPHYRSPLKDILPIKHLKKLPLAIIDENQRKSKQERTVLISIPSNDHPFLAVQLNAIVTKTQIFLPADQIQKYKLTMGETLPIIFLDNYHEV